MWYLNLEALASNMLVFWVGFYLRFKSITLMLPLRSRHMKGATQEMSDLGKGYLEGQSGDAQSGQPKVAAVVMEVGGLGKGQPKKMATQRGQSKAARSGQPRVGCNGRHPLNGGGNIISFISESHVIQVWFLNLRALPLNKLVFQRLDYLLGLSSQQSPYNFSDFLNRFLYFKKC